MKDGERLRLGRDEKPKLRKRQDKEDEAGLHHA